MSVKKSSPLPPSYGELWPGQGGLVVDFVPPMSGRPGWYLIAPTGAQAELENVPWGQRDLDVPDAKSDWDGLVNTVAMAESGSRIGMWARDLVIDGHRDFYIPSRREMRLLWARTPELFQSRWYWSSTQFSRNYAWDQTFSIGYQDIIDKSFEARVRAVRRFTIL